MRARAWLPLLLLALGLTPLSGCRDPESTGTGNRRGSGSVSLFAEITEEIGLGGGGGPWPDGTFFLPEIMGPGLALLDYDTDGDLDLLQIRAPPPGRRGSPAPNRLYQQQPAGNFVDVSARSGVADPGFGQGVAVGDTDNDGDLDIYVANYGPDAFYLNDGDGSFTEATGPAGFAGDSWSTAAAFCDYDRDGFLDLYVAHYLRFDYASACRSPSGAPDYCGPQLFEGLADTLYRNDGDGTFTDVTGVAGLRHPDGGRKAKGLGVVCLDLTGDGWADFYVANDGEANQLWVNRADGAFEDQAVMRGLAVNRQGHPEASMGLTVGDVDRDGSLDLFMTHLAMETNTLFAHRRGALYADRTIESGLAEHDRPFTGFGCGLFDFDHDGDLDLAVVNGRVRRGSGNDSPAAGSFWKHYAEPNLLFENVGEARFSNVSSRAGRFGSSVEVSRGLALGDLDGDGDLDLVVSNVDDSLRVYRNDAPPPGRRWLAVRARTGARDALGALVTLRTDEGDRVGAILSASSYLSANPPLAHFGLGAEERVERFDVTWPDGKVERFDVDGVDRAVVLRRGAGRSR